ncbi:hypothetical protein MKW94_028024 [Papaver nudicaule]|uniref:Uncharacterized protein n=1 Tax=Papaver nudicaule TaxID=74823 RepID=A0AA41V6D8_PAPNU|nr:hypothetical protein [Papaver nudicaule]MCL7044587.1 hypothetical protein [Papaver nudicaule]
MVVNRESTPPPLIGKAGRYTVFITPPATPKQPSSETKSATKPISLTRLSSDTSKPFKSHHDENDDSPTKPMTPKQTFETKSETLKVPSYTAKIVPPPVLPPPKQFEKVKSSSGGSDGSVFGFFWNAVAKVQDAHSSLDEYLAHWFGLNHSKYQWALDDYYESQGMGKGDQKSKELMSKEQNV